jgi:hypothetical protein
MADEPVPAGSAIEVVGVGDLMRLRVRALQSAPAGAATPKE